MVRPGSVVVPAGGTYTPPPPDTSPAFLTSITGTGQALYFTDQYGQPYMVRWDEVWALIVNAGNSGGATTWQSDMAGYCAARAAQGFNGFHATPTACDYAGVGPSLDGATWDGVHPFTSPGVLNNTFWTRVDYLLSTAAGYGLTVCLCAMFSYAQTETGGCLNGWTSTQCGNYGTALGTRYASTPNVVWELGDDYNDTFDNEYSAFLTGLRGAGASQLVSVESESQSTCRYSTTGGVSFAWGISNAQYDWVYDYNPSYDVVEFGYTEAAAHSVPSRCVCHMDGVYDNQYGGKSLTESVELFWRKWIWWALSSGSRGAMYGNGDLFDWPAGALAGALVTANPGSSYVKPAALKTAWDTFASFPGWYLLVPDTSSALVTAGRGTRIAEQGVGWGYNDSTLYVGGNTYVSASKTPDGNLAVIYIPSAVTITVNGALMTAGYTATWVDPASGATSAATIAATYSHAAANSAGDHDWVLVLSTGTA